MAYYQLTPHREDYAKDLILGGDFFLPSGSKSDYEFSEGNRLDIPKDSKVKLEIDWHPHRSKLGTATDCLHVSGNILMSRKMSDILIEYGINNIQFIDLNIENAREAIDGNDFVIANIVGTCDCVDYKKSELTFFDDGDIDDITRLVLDVQKIPNDLLVFRLEKEPMTLIFHSSVVDLIQSNNLTGCVFEYI